jgi:hypothetical protein
LSETAEENSYCTFLNYHDKFFNARGRLILPDRARIDTPGVPAMLAAEFFPLMEIGTVGSLEFGPGTPGSGALEFTQTGVLAYSPMN